MYGSKTPKMASKSGQRGTPKTTKKPGKKPTSKSAARQY